MSKEEAFKFMKINIYYGGRGELVDPTMAVLDRMTDVLKSLNVNVDVTRYDIHEHKNQIPTLHQTIEGCDGIILATTVEWLGIGGYMMEFLDSLWLYGNRDQISSIYMQPVVLSTTTGEREAMLTLENAWETLGGPLCEGMCGYVADAAEFSANRDFEKIIEKKAENLYRTLSQKPKALPSSKQAVSQSVQRTQRIILTPQESEQLSQYAVDDRYVKKQKEDIIELSSMYRNLLGGADEKSGAGESDIVRAFVGAYVPQTDEWLSFVFEITDEEKSMLVAAKGSEVECRFLSRSEAADAYDSESSQYDIYSKITMAVLSNITSGRETFQRAFSTGEMTAKGRFEMIRMLDRIFPFKQD